MPFSRHLASGDLVYADSFHQDFLGTRGVVSDQQRSATVGGRTSRFTVSSPSLLSSFPTSSSALNQSSTCAPVHDSSVFLDPDAELCRGWINYPTVLLLYVLVKLLLFWNSFSVAYDSMSAKSSSFCSSLASKMFDIQKAALILTRFFERNIFLMLASIIDFLELIAMIFYKCIEKLLLHSLSSVVHFVNCVHQLLGYPEALTLPLPDFSASKALALRYAQEATVVELSDFKGVSIEACSRLPDLTDFEAFYTILWYTFLGVIVSLVLGLVLLNVAYCWYAHHAASTRLELLSAYFTQHLQASSKFTLLAFHNFQKFVRSFTSPRREKFKSFLRCCLCIRDHVFFDHFFMYVDHPPSWFCIGLGLLGLSFCLLLYIVVYLIRHRILHVLGGFFFEVTKEAGNLLHVFMSEEMKNLKGHLIRVGQSLPNFVIVDLSIFDSIFAEFMSDLTKFTADIVSYLGNIESSCLKLIFPSEVLSSINDISKNVPMAKLFFLHELFEEKDLRMLSDAMKKYIDDSVTSDYIDQFLERLYQNLLHESLFYGAVFIYGSVVIWQGLYYAHRKTSTQ